MSILSLVASAAIALSQPIAATTPEQEPIAFLQYPDVYQVICTEGKGTAFEVGPHKFLSVAHVTAMNSCKIKGQPITVTEQDGSNDFSQLTANIAPSHPLAISCDGYHAGEWVWSVGYANGAPFQTAIALYVTYERGADGERVLIGPLTVIPGMSGGPVMNAKGQVVGTVNAYVKGSIYSFSRDLKDTSVCRSR